MLKLSTVTNGTGKVSVVMVNDLEPGANTRALGLTPEEAIDLAAQLLIHARNVQDGIHDNTEESRVITRKRAVLGKYLGNNNKD